MSGKYGEPWKEGDFYHHGYAEISDSGDRMVCRSCNQGSYAEAQIRRARLAVNACQGLSDSALDAGVVGKVREALKAFADSRIKDEPRGNVYALGELHAAYDLCAEALSLLSQEDK